MHELVGAPPPVPTFRVPEAPRHLFFGPPWGLVFPMTPEGSLTHSGVLFVLAAPHRPPTRLPSSTIHRTLKDSPSKRSPLVLGEIPQPTRQSQDVCYLLGFPTCPLLCPGSRIIVGFRGTGEPSRPSLRPRRPRHLQDVHDGLFGSLTHSYLL